MAIAFGCSTCPKRHGLLRCRLGQANGAGLARACFYLGVIVQSGVMHWWLARIVLVFTILSASLTGGQPLQAAGAPAGAAQTTSAQAILAAMSPAQRVGQLFVVGFYGASAGQGSSIYDLVTNFKVGGVLIAAANDNITDTVQTPTQVLSLTNQLQADAAAGASISAAPGATKLPPYIPLLISVSHEGDGYPFTDVLSGVTSLPHDMAIGATWHPSLAETAGHLVGTELSALGVNMLLGPSLDVLKTPQPGGADLGTSASAGDPY